MKIYGAGIAGLLAGSVFQTARIFEAGPEDQAQHKAVLRFRTPNVGDAVGIDFKKVRVHKGIWDDGRFVQPNIALANAYSQKVIGKLADRSIWNLESADRFIAPADFLEQLRERCGGRVTWNHRVTAEELMGSDEPAISTLPMPVVARMVGATGMPDFKHEPITVKRWRVPGADVHQTVYFPSRETSLYRVSLTGDLLIAEYANEADTYDFFNAFALEERDCVAVEKIQQNFGKIAKIPEDWRRHFIYDLTQRYSVFSLGRYGTWRQILLDDIISDLAVLKKLMGTSLYDLRKLQAR